MEASGRLLARRRLLAHALLAAGLFAAFALVTSPPESSAWYPACPVAKYLHLLCPGCGATRALAALLRGRLRDAIGYNPLFVAVLPGLVVGSVECYRRAVSPRPFHWPQVPAWVPYGLLGLCAIFMLVRNNLLRSL